MMMEKSAIFDAYINANILLGVGLMLWILARWVMIRIGLKSAYLTQLRLLNGAFLAILACPFVVALYFLALQSGLLPQNYSLNLTDLVVAQYLNGNVAMAPDTFQSALSWRETITADILAYKHPVVQATGALLALMAGCIVFKTVKSIANLRRIIRRSYPWRKIGRLQIRLSDTVSVPFSTRGFRNRYIVIPSAMLTRSEDLKMALAHEFHHLRHSDIEWEIGLEALKPLFFWNPAFHIWKRNVEHLRELACDQIILARGRYNPHAYGACLLRVCKASVTSDRSQTMIMPQVALVQMERPILRRNSDDFLRRRVTSLLETHEPSRSSSLAYWMMLPLAGIILLAGVSIQKPSDWSHDRLMLSTIVNLERMETINSLAVRP